jgi:uncharacterized protein YidB (DUF937 family)
MSILSTLAGALEGAANPNATGTSAPNQGAVPGGMGAAGGAGIVVSQIISMIQSRPGGLAGLLQSFQQGGLGHLVQSWVGTGQNLPVSPDQLRNTLGSDWISRITQAAGLPQSEVEQHLATLLPQVVDHLTPNGQLPQGDLGSELATLAQRFLQR